MRLAIGTAQFGLNYGVSNKIGRISQENIKRILDLAHNNGINTLDTASDYGTSESVLGMVGVSRFKVITKFGALPDGKQDVKHWVCNKVDQSLSRLNADSLHGCLMHRPSDLLGPNGDHIYEALIEKKSQGLIKNIGISIYSPVELENLTHRFDFDIIQAPFNIFDRRLDSSGWLARLAKSGTQIHARSVFLQGLLLMNSYERPEYFTQWTPLLSKYDNWIANSQFSALEACIDFIKRFDSIDKIIIGVTSFSQLSDLVKAFSSNSLFNIPDDLFSDDLDLINPSKWSL